MSPSFLLSAERNPPSYADLSAFDFRIIAGNPSPPHPGATTSPTSSNPRLMYSLLPAGDDSSQASSSGFMLERWWPRSFEPIDCFWWSG